VAKDSSTGHGLDGKGESLFPMAFPMDIDGFSKLFDALKGRCGDLSEVLVAMESTGCYHINLFSFLTSKGVTAVVLNPLLASNFSKLSLRKTPLAEAPPVIILIQP
jgi:transposase